MSTPSYMFSGLDKETLDLAQELNSLGGGDATACNVEIHALIDNKISAKDYQVLFGYGKTVGIRDVLLPRNHPTKENMKSFPVTSVLNDSTFHKEQLSSDCVSWTLKGFNSCILSIGMRNLLKSSIVVGEFGSVSKDSLSLLVLEKLFDNLDSDLKQTIGLSVWMVHDQHQIDLLVSPSSSGSLKESLECVNIECPDLSIAIRVLEEASARMPGASNPTNVKESDRGHLFIRVTLHSVSSSGVEDESKGTVSHIYLVDLLGLVDIDNSKVYAKLSEDDRIATRSHNIQLSSVFKVLAEMRSVSQAAEHTNKNKLKLTSARNSRVTTVLAPIVQGNTKTLISLALQDGESHAAESKNLFTSLLGVTDVVTACYRVKGVPLRSLRLQQYDSVLGPHYSNKKRNRSSSSSSSVESQQVYQQQHQSTHSHSGVSVSQLSPVSPGGVSVVSEDFGDVDLQAVLNEDYSQKRRSSGGGGSVQAPSLHSFVDSRSHLVHESSLPAFTSISHISNEVNKTMDEFHDLMEELQNDSATRHNSSLLSQKVAVNRFLHEEEQLERSVLFNESKNKSYSRASVHPSYLHSDRSGEDSQLVPQQQQSPQRYHGSYRGMLSTDDVSAEDLLSTPAPHYQTDVNRSVLRHEAERSVYDAELETEDIGVTEMIRALRELQRNASQADKSMIESEISRLVNGSGMLHSNATPIPSFKTQPFKNNHSSSSSRYHKHETTEEEVEEEHSSYLHQYNRGIDQAVDNVLFESSDGKTNKTNEDRHQYDDIIRVEDVEDAEDSLIHNEKSSENKNEYVKSIDFKPQPSAVEPQVGYSFAPLPALANSQELFQPTQSEGYEPTNYGKSYSSIFQEKLKAFRANSQEGLAAQSDSYDNTSEERLSSSNTVSNPQISITEPLKSKTTHFAGDNRNDVVKSVAHSFEFSPVLDAEIPEKVFSSHLEATNEIEKLKRTNQSLMEALREEKELRRRTEEKLQRARDDVLEVQTQCDVELDNHKLEIVQLKNQIRSLCDDYSLSDVFVTFEENVSRLVRENSILRKQNIQLELLELDLLENKGKYTAHPLAEEEKSINGPSEKARLHNQLKKAGKENNALKDAYEELKLKERQFAANTKLAQDSARRLKQSHHELTKTKQELEQALLVSNTHERDLYLLKQETMELKKSEGTLKAERANMLAEVAQLRERVGELEDEKKRNIYLSKFVNKHSQPTKDDPFCNNNNSAVPKSVVLSNFGKLVERENNVNRGDSHRPQQHHHHPIDNHRHTSVNVPGVKDKSTPGAYDAQYTRQEERSSVSDNADLEVLLNAMHESIIANSPALLPVFRKLNNEIYEDRTRSLEQRVKLLEKAYPIASVPLSPSRNNKGKLDTSLPVKSYSRNFAAGGVDRTAGMKQMRF